MFRFTIRDVLWLTLFTAFAVGWWVNSQKLPATARASGAVRIAGKRLLDGRLLLHSPDGQIIGARVKNGDFRFAQVPISSFGVEIGGAGVPSRYSNENSGLTLEVRGGNNTFDFDLR